MPDLSLIFKGVMCERQQSLMQHRREGEGDTVCSSTNTSRWSSPSGLRCSSNSSCCSFDIEEKASLLKDNNSEALSSDRWQDPEPSGRKQGMIQL